MAKRFKKGDTVYVPVTVAEVEHEDRWYDYVVRTPAVDGVKAEFPFCVKDEEVKTAEEVIKENYPFWDGVKQMDRITALEAENASLKESLHEASEENLANDEALAQMSVKKAELEALLKEVTATRDEAIRQNNALVEENDKLGTERDQRNKDILAMKKDRDNLLAENEKLKAELKKWYAGYVSQSDYAELSKAYTDKCAELEAFKAEHDKYVMDLEEARDGAVDESLERKNRVTTMEEVIVALVEKIRRLEGDET